MAVKTNVVGGATMQPGGKLAPYMADKGDPGAQGPSAYQLWLAAGNTVTVQQQAILTGIVSLLAGATANILVVEQ